jgi:hypothetical protein
VVKDSEIIDYRRGPVYSVSPIANDPGLLRPRARELVRVWVVIQGLRFRVWGVYYFRRTTISSDSVTQKCWFNIDTQKDESF